jgi:energy-coupling factor transporter transmembrane protein EcfT
MSIIVIIIIIVVVIIVININIIIVIVIIVIVVAIIIIIIIIDIVNVIIIIIIIIVIIVIIIVVAAIINHHPHRRCNQSSTQSLSLSSSCVVGGRETDMAWQRKAPGVAERATPRFAPKTGKTCSAEWMPELLDHCPNQRRGWTWACPPTDKFSAPVLARLFQCSR